MRKVTDVSHYLPRNPLHMRTRPHTPAHARTHLLTRACTGTLYQVSITEWDAFAADGDAPLAQTTSRESSEHSRQSSRHPLQSPPHSPLPIPRFPPSSWVEHVPMRAASSDDDVAQQVRRSQPVCASEIFVCVCVCVKTHAHARTHTHAHAHAHAHTHAHAHAHTHTHTHTHE